jgi:hypothetical protein
MPSQNTYDTIDQTIPPLMSPILGRFTSEDGNFSTYYGQGYYQPWYQCFCKDGCPPEQPACGRCASQQFCGDCDLKYSAYCDSTNVFGGLGWT